MLSPRLAPAQLHEGSGLHTPYNMPPRLMGSSYGLAVQSPSLLPRQHEHQHQHQQQYMYGEDGWPRTAASDATAPRPVPTNTSGRQSPYENGVGDGSALPTLSSVLHNSWSPPRWPPQQQQRAIDVPFTAARSPPSSFSHGRGHTLLLRPTGPAQEPQSSVWPIDCGMKSEPSSPYSPTAETPRLSEDCSMNSRRRDSCSSTSSFSTGSIFGDVDHDAEPKISTALDNERKASRYLREMDRRAILERLARGEKQATLAKEYHVSRAAICNLYKHRHEVMARTDEDPFAKHPKKRKNKKTLKSRRSRSLRLTAANSGPNDDAHAVVTPPSAPSRVHQVQSDAVLLLLTVMSDRRSSVEEFRRASERVLWLLVEESLAVVPIKLAQVMITDEAKVMGVTTEHPPCAVSMEQHSSPMLEVYRLLEPDRPHGRIKVNGNNGLELSDSNLPTTLKYHNVFLCDVAVVSSDSVRAMIECVKQRGALEVMIYVVALFISAEVVETLHEVYPHVQIVTTQIESNVFETEKRRRSCVDVVLGRFDQVYDTQYTLV